MEISCLKPLTHSVGRIGEQGPDGWAYHHGDALGSLRQLTDGSGVGEPWSRGISRMGMCSAARGAGSAAMASRGSRATSAGWCTSGRDITLQGALMLLTLDIPSFRP